MASATFSDGDFLTRLSPADFLAACDRAFRLWGQGVLLNPPRRQSLEGGIFRLEMPALWPGRYQGRKVIVEEPGVGGQLGSRRAYIELEDLVRGAHFRMDADYATDMRTGAAGALGIKYLAQGPVDCAAVLGTGRVARCLARSADQLFGLHEIRATSRQAANREVFARDLAPLLRAPLKMAASLEECLEGADAVLVAVPTPQPILTPAHLGPRTLLSVMAGDSRTRQLAPQILEELPVLVDHPEQALQSGEFIYAGERGSLERIALARDAAGQVLTIGDAADGRLGAARPRLAYFTGLAVQDLCVAVALYESQKKE
ncbi:MAG: NAD(P)-binding domain-containing protein [Candidatus Handelsmanbacteria bacterium]|nr:NAD(P)-binding domain-containing protein [Candidatus Handelsmanbacteria bacterium]